MPYYTTYVQGEAVYKGESLALAARAWDAATFNRGGPVAGGVSVQSFRDGLMVRDGWIMHVYDDGTVFLNPGIGGDQ